VPDGQLGDCGSASVSECALHLNIVHKLSDKVLGSHPGKCCVTCSSYFIEPESVYGPIVTRPKTVGMVIATGNVGASLTFDVSKTQTYVTRDGGSTWKKISGKTCVYDFADHGGFMLWAIHTESVGTYSFSTDYGATSSECTITGGSMIVSDVISEPGGASSSILLQGTRGTAGVVVKADFSSYYSRTCSDVDFENWALAGENACILGVARTYQVWFCTYDQRHFR
jgi:hypothetical protein